MAEKGTACEPYLISNSYLDCVCAALVTGASSGLGVEFATGLAMAGADVAVLARRLERLQAVARQLEALGRRALPIQADVRQADQIDAALEQIQATLGPIDILVNNAGVAPVSRAERHAWRSGRTRWRSTSQRCFCAVRKSAGT